MIVTRSQFDACLRELKQAKRLSLDTETTGLRPYHGDRLFSIIIGIVEGGDQPRVTPFYFNFQAYVGFEPGHSLSPAHLARLRELFDDPDKLWFIHNAKYDLAILANEGISLAGTIHCTRAMGRVEYNEHRSYSLAACAARLGLKKDETVELYVKEHNLIEKTPIPHTNKHEERHRYDLVPYPLITAYGLNDAHIGGYIGHTQEETLKALTRSTNATVPAIWRVVENERRLTKTVFRMEQRGVLVDKPYCVRALAYERDRVEKSLQNFKRETGRDFLASPKLFAEIFASEKELWEFTDKGNPSFEGDTIKRFKNPAAKIILEFRDAKSKCDFYAGFLYHADRDGAIHPHLDPDGARTGRFSSSEPNLQNLTSENATVCRACGEEFEDVRSVCGDCGSRDIEHPEFLVRRALIPRPGFIFIMPDYDQMEYRMMFDYACGILGRESELVKKIKYEGLDPHQATADVVTAGGTPLSRKRAKNGNFAILYGSGNATLAATIGSSVKEAAELRASIFKAAPEIKKFVDEVMSATHQRGYIRNWMGRRSYFPNPNLAYKSPNSLIQGGTADVNKVALNEIDEYLLALKSKLVLTIHDENPIEVHEDEIDTVPKAVKAKMESVYPWQYLPLTVGMEYSTKSLGDKVKGWPGASTT